MVNRDGDAFEFRPVGGMGGLAVMVTFVCCSFTKVAGGSISFSVEFSVQRCLQPFLLGLVARCIRSIISPC